MAFKTLGCRLNQAETATMAGSFSAAGYAIVPFNGPCDVAVINSCTVTKTAEKESIRVARKFKKNNPRTVVVLAGCVERVHGEDISRTSGADILLPPDRKLSLPAILNSRHGMGQAVPPGKTDALPLFSTVRALVKVQDGCDFGCAYCAVPAARGTCASRSLKDIVSETALLAGAGFKEIVLTGANLGCYSDGRHRLVDVIEAIEAIPSVARIRMSSIELSTCERAVVDCMARSEKLCRFLHIPVQSGDDGVLAGMGRRYTTDDIRRFVDYAAKRLGAFGLGTDIIVGLPGETDSAFANTVRLVEDLPFSNLHVFPYSKRPGTRAALMANQVPGPLKKERCASLLALGAEKRMSFARRFVGETVSVLIEKMTGTTTGTGWTGEYLKARITAEGSAVNSLATGPVSRTDGDALVVYAQ